MLPLIFVYILHGKDKLTMEWLPWLQTSWQDSAWLPPVCIVYFADYTRQPERKQVLPRLAYNKDYLQLTMGHLCEITSFYQKNHILKCSCSDSLTDVLRVISCKVWARVFLQSGSNFITTNLYCSVFNPPNLLLGISLTNLHLYCWGGFLWCYSKPISWRNFRGCT